ncbi:integrase catalytic domain-containing protein [Trichonephila clavipes]|nr:integrase catalytic domain-containing protein [Trichonephila clavipes]
MYKNALKEDLKRVVEDLDDTVESTDTIAKLKTKIENSSTFESDPDFVKTLIQNCIDERVSRNEREVTLEKQKIELAKLQLAQLEKEVELQTAKNKALSLNPAAKVEDKQFETNIENMIKSETYIQFAARLTANFQYYCSLRKVNSFESLCDLIISDKLFETLNKETATHISIREAEDWFRPIDLAKECDIYISSKNGSRAYAYPSVVSVSSVIKNSSYDLPHVKNFNTRNDSSSLIKDYKCNKIKSTKLKLSIIREKCSDIVLCKKVKGAMKRSSVNFNTPSPMKTKHRRFSSGLDEKGKRKTYRCGQRTVRLAGYSIQWLSTTPRSLRAQAQQIQTRTETMGLLRIRKGEKEKKRKRNDGGARAGVTVKTPWNFIC